MTPGSISPYTHDEGTLELMVRPEGHDPDEPTGRGFSPVARTTVSQEIVKQIVTMIEAGELRPGDALPPERELQQLLGVGRTSVREALRALSLFGIVDARPGGGTFIARPTEPLIKPFAWRMLLSRDKIRDLGEARRVIEGEMVAQAAIRRTPEQLDVLRGHLEAMAATVDDGARFLEADLGFHLAVAAMGGNVVLREMLVALRSLLQRFIERILVSEPRRGAETALAHHGRIYAAVAAGDPIAARQAMSDHLQETAERLIEVESARLSAVAAPLARERSSASAGLPGGQRRAPGT
ncbi:MAG: FadR family transcriptional regulator [Chloroflexi bacterium]|nr:FadR family transcriptional regulator [Chloroflexota bacterium]